MSAAFSATRSAWLHVSFFSAVVNILMLTGSLFMMQVYDRVLASRSVATLAGVSILALLAYALQGWLDHIRLKMLGRIGASVDAALSPLTLRAAMTAPLQGLDHTDGMQPFKDLNAVRGFLASMGPTALIDMPFAPIFLLVTFVLHPWLGWLSIAGMIVIVGLTFLVERRSVSPGKALSASSGQQAAMLETARRNAEAIAALGMTQFFSGRFDQIHARHVADTLKLSEASGGVSSFAKMFRFVLQSAVLGLGAYLVIRGEMSGGSMLAASILTSRALAPVELAVAHLKPFLAARQGYRRLGEQLPRYEVANVGLTLPAPSRRLSVDDVTITPPGTRTAIVSGVRLALEAGQVLGLIGPSGSGKSSLARCLAGIWPPTRGGVRLDGASLTQWDRDQLGQSIGYLPQDVELFPGSVAENIARFNPDATSAQIIAAAEAAGAHDMIVGLPRGYETPIGEGGALLSGGQRQRIALARALFGEPFLVILDEPNANLDAEGDEALSAAIRGVSERKGIVIVITHRPSGLAAAHLVGVMVGGRLQKIGPRDAIMTQTAVTAGVPAERVPSQAAAGPIDADIAALRQKARDMQDAMQQAVLDADSPRATRPPAMEAS